MSCGWEGSGLSTCDLYEWAPATVPLPRAGHRVPGVLSLDVRGEGSLHKVSGHSSGAGGSLGDPVARSKWPQPRSGLRGRASRPLPGLSFLIPQMGFLAGSLAGRRGRSGRVGLQRVAQRGKGWEQRIADALLASLRARNLPPAGLLSYAQAPTRQLVYDSPSEFIMQKIMLLMAFFVPSPMLRMLHHPLI